MKKRAVIKKKESAFNDFNAPITKLVNKGFVYGVLDVITPNMVSKQGKFVDDSSHIFICDFADIEFGDVLDFDGKQFSVKHVDDPLFMNHHLEIELKVMEKREGI